MVKFIVSFFFIVALLLACNRNASNVETDITMFNVTLKKGSNSDKFQAYYKPYGLMNLRPVSRSQEKFICQFKVNSKGEQTILQLLSNDSLVISASVTDSKATLNKPSNATSIKMSTTSPIKK